MQTGPGEGGGFFVRWAEPPSNSVRCCSDNAMLQRQCDAAATARADCWHFVPYYLLDTVFWHCDRSGAAGSAPTEL